MAEYPNVNDVLRQHALTGGGAACFLRSELALVHPASWYPDALLRFFRSTDDYERNRAAHAVILQLLESRSVSYLARLWDLARAVEDRRAIRYEKQTGHGAHSLYLFLLTIWYHDNLPRMKQLLRAFYLPKEVRAYSGDELFLLMATYATLLHDVGYVLCQEGPNTDTEVLEQVDSLFLPESVAERFPHLGPSEQRAVSRRAAKSIAAWTRGGLFPQFKTANTPAAVLRELDKAPWMHELIPAFPGSMTGAMENVALAPRAQRLRPDARRLRQWAQTVAGSGYSKKRLEPALDHGYASGCLLGQTASFQYWMAIKCGEKEIGGKYSPENLARYILPACHAVAAHNVRLDVAADMRMLPLRFSMAPLLFLSVVCDELQKWHRPPVGAVLTGSLDAYDPPRADDITLQIFERHDRRHAVFDCQHAAARTSIAKSLERLDVVDVQQRIGMKFPF